MVALDLVIFTLLGCIISVKNRVMKIHRLHIISFASHPYESVVTFTDRKILSEAILILEGLVTIRFPEGFIRMDDKQIQAPISPDGQWREVWYSGRKNSNVVMSICCPCPGKHVSETAIPYLARIMKNTMAEKSVLTTHQINGH